MRTVQLPTSGRALGALAVVGVTAVAAGCGEGGGDQQRTTAHAPSSIVEKSLDKAKAKPGTERARAHARHRASQHHAQNGNAKPPKPNQPITAEGNPKKFSQASQSFLMRLPPAQRRRTVELLVQASLRSYGFNGASATARHAGQAVTVNVPRAQACNAGPGDAAQLAKRIQQTAPIVRTIVVEVAENGDPLDTYIKANCKKSLTLPNGPGSTVLKKSGSGAARSTMTKSFTVNAGWAVDYRNDGQFLRVVVYRDGKRLQDAVLSRDRGTGTQNVALGPGTYRLKIFSSASWTVRVRDGI
jgi:hypothetical protein